MKTYPKKDVQDILHKIEELRNDVMSLRKQTEYKRGLVCPNCGSYNNRVINIRESENCFKVRRRVCCVCDNRWNTTEIITDLGVVKRKLDKMKRD